MSNLARKLQQEQQHSPVQAPKKATVKRTSWLTPGEKLLALLFGLMVCFGGTYIIAKQAAIYEINKDIQLMESSIQEQEKVNKDLAMQVDELSAYERIEAIAKKLGFAFDGNNVKVVQD
ncbi:cell division protein FtsL [Bacillus sp. T33-2]|uniref:cell division protein FtsL n=1 Tax=Bacillus sp. T33-2 TaxID=2054168 RepID=UPI000C75CA7B|nr:cell division protein FtsL [Bacillus sp. T33-2]PLR97384.1 cell division protein FtsL [Bacillus sp. T33-2]